MTRICPRCGSQLFPSVGKYKNSFNCVYCCMVYAADTGKATTHKTLMSRENPVEHIQANGQEEITTEFFCEKA